MAELESSIEFKTSLSYKRRKVVLITGITGQDGSYLAEFLLGKGYEVHGLVRRVSNYPQNLRNIEHIKDKLVLHFGDMESEHHLCSVIYNIMPDEIYHLAAQSDVKLSFEIPEYTANITGLGTLRLLEAVRNFSIGSKVYFSGSSEQFGSSPPLQNEETPMIPLSPYGASKLFSYQLCNIYKKSYDMYISSGILFNHESPRRGENFVTRKICKGIADILKGRQKEIKLGNIYAKRDWGFCPEYCEQMWNMLQQRYPDNYVIGTGEAHTIEDFLVEAFNLVELNWEDKVKIDHSLYRPVEVSYLLADSSKARKILGWSPKVKFKELVKIMLEAELEVT